jgi:1,4-alpha-glucan branching enzyme
MRETTTEKEITRTLIKVNRMPGRYARAVRFEYKGPEDATGVALVGNFNGWSRASHTMYRNAAGQWEVIVHLAPGTYEYQFLINNTEWDIDPARTSWDTRAQDIMRGRVEVG